MKAVILAAGIGSRLKEKTNDIPKCMIEVNGKKIIDNQIEILLKNNIKKIYIVGGFKFDILKKHIESKFSNKNIKLINNKDFLETNNMFSFSLTKDYTLGNNILLMNGDVFISNEVIRDLIKFKAKNAIACDTTTYNDESMKIVVKNGSILKISKQVPKEESFACSIDIYKFSKKGTKILFREIAKFFNEGDFKSWTELAINEMFSKIKVVPHKIKGRWYEIDNQEDLDKAERVFKND